MVTPPLNFTGDVQNDIIDHKNTPTAKKIDKLCPSLEQDDPDIKPLVKNPWDPHTEGYSDKFNSLTDTEDKQPPSQIFKKHKKINRFSGLPCPPITRSQTAKLRQTQTPTLASLSQQPQQTASPASGYVHDDVTCAYLDVYDPHMYLR